MRALFSLFFIALLCLSFNKKPVADSPPLWLRYPAISPDGKSVAFCYKGHIYKVDAAGGTALALTLGDAYDYMPVWSPDGKWLAFASDRHGNFDVYVMPSEGGKSQRLTYHSAGDIPSCFSPDGKEIYFSSTRVDAATSYQCPNSRLPELYKVSVEGGREKMVLSTPAEEMKCDASGNRFLFIDKKGGEDTWRKHHTSAVTRDIWIYEKKNNSFRQLTSFSGEDRNPQWSADEKEIYYLSEQSGSYNICKMNVEDPSKITPITKFVKDPVRFFTLSKTGTMCFTFDGEIYTMGQTGAPVKLAITIPTDENALDEKNEVMTSGATEMEVSPNGKEVVFVVRGEVFVSSVETGITKRITNTPGMERSVSFSPDGRSVLYAGERNKIWGIFQSTITRAEELYFFNSTVLKEEALIVTDKESFQPKYSPDGNEVAFIEDRTSVKVYNIKTKESRLILPADKSYSYSDGDQWFDWSPDGKYLLLQFMQDQQWRTQVGIVEATGKGKLIDLTESAYENSTPKWMMDGKMMIWFTTRHGMKNHASHGWQTDVYGQFFTKESWDRFKMTKDEYLIIKEKEDKEKEKNKFADTKSPLPVVKIEMDELEDRKARLTLNSADMGDAILSRDGEQLYYLSKFESGYDLWTTKFRDHETKLLLKLDAQSVGNLVLDKEGKNLFFVSDGHLSKVNIEKNEKKEIPFKAEMLLKPFEERAEMYEHMWRQAYKKFYVSDMQKTDWKYYKEKYARFLPHINNNRDFAEVSSELLGELNASHTGCRYYPSMKNADETAALGLIYDENYSGKGIKVAEVIEKGPLDNSSSLVKTGVLIEKIDGVEITENTNYFKLLNRKSSKPVLLSFYDETTKKRWDESMKPITLGEQNELLYQRWMRIMQDQTEKLSGGKLGYVHVRGMNDESFRVVYEKALGKYANKSGLIVDTRYNGGGWLHDDLATFLNGKEYIKFMPRERLIGTEPQAKWNKVSCVLMSEGNYSDAHMFPYVYKQLAIGKLIGMPVPGTGTAVWWETLVDNSLVFGIPQVGVVGVDGKYLENNQLEPDLKVANKYEDIVNKHDTQLEKAVDELMGSLKK
jgi:tricorn protease